MLAADYLCVSGIHYSLSESINFLTETGWDSLNFEFGTDDLKTVVEIVVGAESVEEFYNGERKSKLEIFFH